MLITLLEPWLSALDSPAPVYITAISLAFDSITHKHLLLLLKLYDFHPSAINLIASYLSNRKQVVKITNEFSRPQCIKSGVPQGSVLGLLLFNLVANGLLLKFDTALAYADDTVLHCQAPTQSESLQKAQSVTKLCSRMVLISRPQTKSFQN